MRIRQFVLTTAVASLAWGAFPALAHAQPQERLYVPAQRGAGPAPAQPSPLTVGWVEEAVEVTVDAEGRPQAVAPLLGTAGSTLLRDAVRQWTFRPATVDGQAVESRVLVIGVFRPPLLINGPTLGTPPVALGGASREVAAPRATAVPDYPLRTTAFGVTMTELLVSAQGRVDAARVVHSVAGLDAVSLAAARQWSFAPAVRGNAAVPSYVYLAFGFQPPVTAGKPR